LTKPQDQAQDAGAGSHPGAAEDIRLTALSHGGGCGCKIAPRVLQEALAGISCGFPHPDLLVGSATADDAAVLRLRDDLALVATTDFFMPIVDDPFDFGRIAATNAISDVYAMGATPCLALAIVGMPINVLPLAAVRRIMEGGAAVCHAAGIPLAGGHSIDSPEPIYGLAVMGTVHPDRVMTNGSARPGDLLVLGKPLGVGILSAVLKKGLLDADGYRALIETTTQLNRPGIAFAAMDGVHALTDVTGFGLLGHLLEVCRASGVRARLSFAEIPVLPAALGFARDGHGPGAIERNWASYGAEVTLDPGLPAFAQRLLCDAQTSGGLLVACDPGCVAQVLDRFRADGFARAAVIGGLEEGPAGVSVG
jgi:selenide, water dikinase